MTDTIRALAGDFPALPQSSWTELAIKALRGADFETTLGRTTKDGISRGPVFFSAPKSAQTINQHARNEFLPWGMRQSLVEASPEAANLTALDDLMGGVSELELRLDASGTFGLAACDLDALDACLKGIDLSLAPIHLDALNHATDHADILIALYARRRLDGEDLKGGLGLSPIELTARHGRTITADELKTTTKLALLCNAAFPKLKIMRVDAALAHEAGASEVEELAMMAASGAAYMRLLMEAGLDADQASAAIEFRLAADADIHLGIAKLRAARRIWAQITASFGASRTAQIMDLHVTTSTRMLSAKDAWTNLIRTSCAGFAAVSGGADALTIKPLTEAIGRPTGFGRRVARNLHILLAEESHLGRVTDPAAGSYLHENLTEQLALKAWEMFQDIEAQGGLSKSLETGWLQGQIANSLTARLKAVEEGDEIILGVTTHPDKAPKAVECNDLWPEITPEEGALSPIRLATQFEGAMS